MNERVDVVVEGSAWDSLAESLYKSGLMLYEKTQRENRHYVQVNDIRMAYLDFGPQDNIPLIWVHGSLSSSYEILSVKDGLVKAGYRLIAIDIRGFGETKINITKFNTSLHHVADDIAVLMDHLHFPKAVIGGYSKGAWVATAFYDTYPDRTLGLLLEE